MCVNVTYGKEGAKIRRTDQIDYTAITQPIQLSCRSTTFGEDGNNDINNVVANPCDTLNTQYRP